MKTMKLFVWTFTLCLAATVILPAQNGEDGVACSVETLKGSYTSQNYIFDVREEDGERVLHPSTMLGVWRADGSGKILAMKIFQKTSRTQDITVWDIDAGTLETTKWGEQTPTLSTVPVFNVEYTVESDCRGTMVFRAPNGAVTGQVYFALFNGGRDGRYLVAVPHPGVGAGIIKKMDAYDEMAERKIDALAAEVAEMKQLLKEIAKRMGLIVK